jgi:predicted O-methyltransferase YrrM
MSFSDSFGCTIVMAARNGLVLVGNNEDRNHPQTIVTFLPATKDYYGRIVFGYDDMPVQGGMNDRGLFVDGNALSPTGWKPEPGRPTFRGIVLMVLLGTCATCEDVKAFFEKFNVPALERARIPVADRSGASMVVEYGRGRVQFVKSNTWYQIATNFVMSNLSGGDYPCWRYRTAEKTLSEAEELSRDLVGDVLEKTHQESGSLTVYSNIYDLKNGMIHLYNMRDFREVVVLNLAEELKKGERRIDLPALFKGPRGEALPTIENILQHYLGALGGKEAVEKIRTRKLSGELTHDFPGQNPPKIVLPAEVMAAAPDKWRLVLKTSSGVQQMGFDGQRGWTQDADRILITNRQARSKLAYLFHPQGALRLEGYFPGLVFKETVHFNGRTEYAVKAAGMREGQPVTLYFDSETGLLNRLGDDLVVERYRPEMGVLHPVQIAITRRGGTSIYYFKDITANIAVEDGRFAIPDLAEVFPKVFEGLADSKVLPLLKDFPSEHEDMNVPCRDGRFLYDLILRKGYKRGLEIGSFTGYSALWMGWAFEKTGGKLTTIEIESEPGEKARRNVITAGLEEVVDVRIADALQEIPRIKGELDFVFIDAWKPDYVKFLRLLRDRVVTGGVIIGHNVTNYARDMQDYLAAIREDPGLETMFEELTAEGMSISFVRAPK